MAKRDGFNFDLLMEKMKSSKPKLLTTLEVQATDHFVGSWKKKGWVDRGLKQWKEVQRRQPARKHTRQRRKQHGHGQYLCNREDFAGLFTHE